MLLISLMLNLLYHTKLKLRKQNIVQRVFITHYELAKIIRSIN